MRYTMLENIKEHGCSCGREHSFSAEIHIGSGKINELENILIQENIKKVFLLADKNTFAAAGEKVSAILGKCNAKINSFIFDLDHVEPNETNTGLALMHYSDCDMVIGIGSGVINDICKIISNTADKLCCIIATAPSMDGYASSSSSMTRSGLKISLPSKCPEIIIGDTDILCSAPERMLVSGIGDIIAKYIALCDWRISALINGEYYCEEIAELVRKAMKTCVQNADGLLKREKAAVEAVFEALILSGITMKLADCSRPASGIEHYISHLWDMRNVEFGTPCDFHGIQCGMATLISAKAYNKLKKIVPSKEKALENANKFSLDEWNGTMREFLGKGAESMIQLEKKEKKYDLSSHAARLEKIISNWDEILKIIDEEIPPIEELYSLARKINLPVTPEEIGISSDILPLTFRMTADIRDKYILSRLCRDLGITDEITEAIR